VTDLPVDHHKKLCLEIFNTMRNLLKNDDAMLDTCNFLKNMEPENVSESFTQNHEIKDWIYHFTNTLAHAIEQNRSASGRHTLVKALEYIGKHYKEDLSLEKIAAIVSLSPNYFSHLFKKSRGESFTEYLNKLRMQEAKKILSTGLYKVYQVADMVGYLDYKYFSSVFKKIRRGAAQQVPQQPPGLDLKSSMNNHIFVPASALFPCSFLSSIFDSK
jgi:two-component system response regulator YesN